MADTDGSRRPRGDGALTYNAERDRWEGRIDAGRDPITGRRVRRMVTARTKTAASRRLRELRDQLAAERDRQAVADGAAPSTVELLAADWLAKSAVRRKAPSTLARVTRRVEQHVIPAVGHYRVDQLRPEHIERWLSAEADAGAALRTIQDYRGDLRQILAWAMRRRLVTWNAAAEAELPVTARPPAPKRSLTEAEAGRLLTALRDSPDRLGPYFTLLLLLGLRPGEADALRWDAIAGDVAVIDAALQRDDAGRPLAIGPTKTKQTRTLRLTPAMLDALRRQRVLQAADRLAAGAGWSPSWDGLVFLNEIGRPLNPSNVRRAFGKACDRAEVPRLTPYELRHSVASLLIAAGHSPYEVADLLGHADTRMLDRHYRHKVTPIVETAAGLDVLLAR